MFNWKKWQKSLASLVMLVGIGVVTYGDFSVGQGVAPDTDFKDLHTGEEVVVKEEEEKPVNEVLAKHRQSEGYDLISVEHREQKEFERLEEIRIEEERIAKEKAEEEARIKAEEEARLAEEARIKAEEEARIKAEAEKKKQQEQQVASSSSQSKQEQPKQEKPKQAPQERRTDGFNFHNYHFSVKSWSGSGGQAVPMETNNVFQWASKPTHYLVERISPAGRVIQQLGMGDTVVLNGKSYVVTNIKRKVPNDNNAMSVLNSVSADITIQTCETTKGANGASDLTLWYLHAQ